MATIDKKTGTVLCDLCDGWYEPAKPAVADMPTRLGPWANVCEEHARSHGIGKRYKVAR